MTLSKIISSALLATTLVTSSFALSKTDLEGNSYSTNTGLAGYYVKTESNWFFYMPESGYLLVHETGKDKVADGAEASPGFTDVTVDGCSITFGNLDSVSDDNTKTKALANQTFTVGTGFSGVYVNYDSTNKGWSFYMPESKYLLVHEAGSSKVADGAEATSDFENATLDATCTSISFSSGTTSPDAPPTPDSETDGFPKPE